MSDKTKLSPVKDRLVPLEDGSNWPSKDEKPIDHEVVMTRYYRRRVRDGDLRDKKAEAGVPGKQASPATADDKNAAGVPGKQASPATATKTNQKAGK